MAERFGCGVDLPVVGDGRREAESNNDDDVSSGVSTESSNDTALSAVIVLRFMLIFLC